MARRTDYQRDCDDAFKQERWSLHGWTRLVKVVALSAEARKFPQEASAVDRLYGYIAVAKDIHGRTPSEMEQILGFQSGTFKDGVTVYSFRRLPQISEYEYELTADNPNGLAENPATSNVEYPPGSAKVHQWRIKKGCAVPVDAKNAVVVLPHEKFDMIPWSAR